MTAIQINTELISSLEDVVFIPAKDMAHATSIALSTWYYIMQSPADITIPQLLAMANGLHIPVRRFFSDGHTHVIGKREDYITEPYLPCRYEGHNLQAIIKKRPDTTWKKASEAVGVTQTRLKNSLVNPGRTPVSRLLAVCNGLDIDPFDIYIDPNPEARMATPHTARGRASATNPDTLLRADIATLHQQLDRLDITVADLAAKYQKLLADHEQLVRRVGASMVCIDDGHTALVAEPGLSD